MSTTNLTTSLLPIEAPDEEWMVVEGSLTFAWTSSPDDFDSFISAVTGAVATLLNVNEAWVKVQVVSDAPGVVSRRLQGGDGSLEVKYTVTAPAEQAQELHAVLLEQTVEDFQVALNEGLASQGLEMGIYVTAFTAPILADVPANADAPPGNAAADYVPANSSDWETDWTSQAKRFATMASVASSSFVFWHCLCAAMLLDFQA